MTFAVESGWPGLEGAWRYRVWRYGCPGSEEGEGAGQWCRGRELKAGLRSAAGKVGVSVAGERGSGAYAAGRSRGRDFPLGPGVRAMGRLETLARLSG